MEVLRMTEWIEKLRQWVAESDNMVFFGGAGVSTESESPSFHKKGLTIQPESHSHTFRGL